MEEEKVDEWELLPPNTSFLNLGLEDIKDLFSKEIDYVDYFIEQPNIRSEQSEHQDKTQVYDEEFVEEIEVEDPKQTICNISELKDNTSIDKDKEDLDGGKPCSKQRGRPRLLVAGIGEMLSIGAAVTAAMVCGFLLGCGQRRRADTPSFYMYTDNKAMKQMVKQANRINQMAMQPATISFGGCFNDML